MPSISKKSLNPSKPLGMNNSSIRTSSEYLVPDSLIHDRAKLIRTLYRQTCRVGFQSAGFSLLCLGRDWDSRRLRQMMLDIVDGLSDRFLQDRGELLKSLSMSRFDQQASTKPHRDGGPRESLLVLGYEPTLIKSQMALADYSRCAHDMGITPEEFLERHNPMFPAGGELLNSYTTTVAKFDPQQFQVLLINNSSARVDETPPRWQGVLHQATVPHPDSAFERVVNSIQLAPAGSDHSAPITQKERQSFLQDDALGAKYGQANPLL